MNEKSTRQRRLSLQTGSAERARPLLALLLAVLAAWLLWAGFGQWQAKAAGDALQAQRERVVQDVTQVLATTRKQTVDVAAAPDVAAAVQAGDAQALTDAFAAAATGALETRVLAADLEAAYAGLPETGYGALALAEQALAEGEPALRVARGGKGNALFGAVALGEEHVGIVAWPLQPLQGAFDSIDPGNGYLALRQGTATVLEKGDAGLVGVAEGGAAKVAGSELRVLASGPRILPGPFGLGAIPALAAGALLLLMAVLVLLWPRLRRTAPTQQVDDEPTLADAIGHAVPPPPLLPDDVPAPPAAAAEAAVTPVPVPSAPALDRGIFRAYDIRGVVGESLNADVARAIGLAIGSVMHSKGLRHIVVGRDGRLSGPEMAGALIAGLRESGREVVDIGLAPTPLVYFAAAQDEAGSCVAVTGSHNPPDYNGFKIVVGGETLSGDAIVDLHRRIVEDDLHRAAQPGALSQRDVSEDYVQRVASDIRLARPLKVVVDAGNGAAGELGPRVLQAIGAEVTELYCEIDGTFPNHHPDPSEPANLADLRRMVVSTGADIGLAFDGDGDRLGVITPAGSNIFPDRLLMLFAADVLERQPGAVIVYDVKCSGALHGWIMRHAGSPEMWKTGHSLIKARMRETGAELAGEMSGHFFFAERWFGFDDGIYSAARLLEILAAREEGADAVFAAIPEGVSTPELKIPVPEPHAFIERFVAEGDFADARSTTIDGLRADWPDGWGLVRASNTTPVLVLRFEADDVAALTRIQTAFRERLLALEPGLELPF
ncbi:phosphomannomutase/phosphoglucomutase [Luteimonas sp. e5]